VLDGESDEALMAAYQAGDVRAFERLVARHEKQVWSFLRRFTRDEAAAEDLLQEVFLRVVKGAQGVNEWKGNSKFSTWVYAIARNLCVDHARRAVHRKASSLDAPTRPDGDSTETLHDRVAAPQRIADAEAAGRQAAGRIDAAIAGLPDEQREVFLMREVMDMPFAEIAAVVGASEPTVKSRMRYALGKLREALIDFRDSGARAVESVGSSS